MLQDPLTAGQAWAQGPAACAGRICCQAESRRGLLPRRRRQLTLTGVNPWGLVPSRCENVYGSGAVEPTTAESLFLELPVAARKRLHPDLQTRIVFGSHSVPTR